MIARLILAAAVAAAFVVSPLGAGAPRTAEAATEIVGTSGTPIRIESKQGRLIRLDTPAETVFVADATIADVEVKTPRLIYLFGKRAGTTTLYVVDKNNKVLLNREVNVTHNLNELRRTLKELLPGERLEVRSVNGAIVLNGQVTTAEASEDARQLARRFVSNDASIINRLGIDAPQQINLRVRIAEVSRQTAKALGIDWDVLTTQGNFVFALASGATVVGAVPAFLGIENFAAPATNTINSRKTVGNRTTRSGFGNFNNGQFDVNGIIDALDGEGLVKILAEPNLSALSGETASFLAGGEFPIPVPQDQNTITIKFKKFGVSLGFTPTIISENRINIKVAPEVSQLSNAGAVSIQGFNIPALTVRRAETTIELGSGQSFAIAGLLQNNSNYNIDSVPWLGEIPIIGALFRSEQFQRDETELLILVTPYVVQPINMNQTVSAPNPAGAASDVNRIIQGAGRRGDPGTDQEQPATSGDVKNAAVDPSPNTTVITSGAPAQINDNTPASAPAPVANNTPAPAAAPATDAVSAPATSGPRRIVGPGGFALE